MFCIFKLLNRAEKSLSLRNLKLERVTFSIDRLLKRIGDLLRSLQSLHIHKFSTKSMVSGVTMRKERIHLQDLSTDAMDDSLFRYLTSFHGLRKFSSFIGHGDHQSNHITILQTMIPYHAESLTKLNMRGGSESQISDLTASVSGNFINLLSVKNLQYFGLQLHIAPCYISIIVSVFCNGQYIVHHTHPVIGSDPGTYYSDLYTKIFPKLQRLVLHVPTPSRRTPRYLLNTVSLPAIKPLLLMTSVASFEIECEGRIYFPRQDETTGIFSYLT